MNPYQIVIDTNVLVAGLRSKRGGLQVIDHAQR
jgi:predicted nucleic acid-binding protein